LKIEEYIDITIYLSQKNIYIMSGKKKKGGEAKPEKKQTNKSFGSDPDVAPAIEGFVAANSTFQSTTVITSVMEKIAQLNSADDIFKLPIKEKIFDMNTALLWQQFIHIGLRKMAEELKYNSFEFDVSKSSDFISQVYDRATEDSIWCHINGDEDEGDEGDEEENEDK
jgi:hypothetical protein